MTELEMYADRWPAIMWIMLLIGCNSAGQGTDGWQFATQRDALAPGHRLAHDVLYEGRPTLYLAGSGSRLVNGCWHQRVPVVPGEHFVFSTRYKAVDVDEEQRSVLVRILWYDANDEQVGRAEYPAYAGKETGSDWQLIRQGYTIPPDVDRARLELVYRWDADGSVYFGGTSFRGVDPPSSRNVRLATIHHRPRNTEGPRASVESYGPLIEEACREGADIICLPEGINLVGTGSDYVSVSETIPGTTTGFLGTYAAQHRCYIVAGLLERDGDAVYNTAVLIDRNGKVAGKYRKLSLPREEIEGGVTPGEHLPVLETDFGTVGMMICWDVTFPEVARHLAMKGAEVILMPIWGGNITLARARAIENQVYLVTSGYDIVSAVFDRKGAVIAEATENDPVAICDVDLDARTLWPWLGDLKNRIPREKPSAKALVAD